MLEKIFAAATPETLSFVIIISIFSVIFHRNFNHYNANKAPAILMTLGILGTFFGIALGLLDFNPDNIQKSVPELINGIRTAFWVSAWGIFCAVTVKVREALWGIPKSTSGEAYQGATVDDLADLLKDVKSALVGTEESTLLGQIKLARQDSTDRLDMLRKSFDDFAEKVADNNSKALIEALEEVMRDFNTKINEQFGENFKQLNEAVGKILEWQEKYRQQVSEMIEQQTVASGNMQKSSESMQVVADRYEQVVQKSEVFTSVAAGMSTAMEGLSKLLAGLEVQREQLQESLKMLATLVQSASTGLPEIESKVVSMTEQLSASVVRTGENLQQALAQAVNATATNLQDNVKSVTTSLDQNIKGLNEELRTSLLNVLQKTNQEFNSNLEKANQEMNGNIKDLVEKTKEQVVALDTALSEELTKSLESFGRQMASLSQKFADDYTPLTDRLREVLEIARRAS